MKCMTYTGLIKEAHGSFQCNYSGPDAEADFLSECKRRKAEWGRLFDAATGESVSAYEVKGLFAEQPESSFIGHPIIEALIEAGVEIEACHEDGKGFFFHTGSFYKSSADIFPLGNGRYRVDTRYGRSDEIGSLEEIVDINHDWWQSYRRQGWDTPAEGWAELMVRFGLVQKRVETITRYE